MPKYKRGKPKKDVRIGGRPKLPASVDVTNMKTPSKYKKGAAWEKGQAEAIKKRRALKTAPASQVRGRMLHEDYSLGPKPPKPKRKRTTTGKPKAKPKKSGNTYRERGR